MHIVSVSAVGKDAAEQDGAGTNASADAAEAQARTAARRTGIVRICPRLASLVGKQNELYGQISLCHSCTVYDCTIIYFKIQLYSCST